MIKSHVFFKYTKASKLQHPKEKNGRSPNDSKENAFSINLIMRM